MQHLLHCTWESGAVVGAVCPAALHEGAPAGGQLWNGFAWGREGRGKGVVGRLLCTAVP